MPLSKFYLIYCLSLVFTCNAFGAISSNTDMGVAVSKVNPYITSNMASLQAKVDAIVSSYKEQNRKEIEARNIYLQRFEKMDKEIALTLREIKSLDQQLIDLKKVH